MFDPEVYIARRARLRQQLRGGVVLLPGNDESPMNYPDNTYPFRQDSSFLYFFGVDAPGLTGLIDVDEGFEMIFGEDLTMDQIIWTGPQPPLREKAGGAGVTQTADRASLAGLMAKILRQDRRVHVLPQYRAENLLAMSELLAGSPAELRQGASLELIRAVVEQRATKTEEELAQIELALETCYHMQTTAMRLARPGVVEAAVAGAMEGIALARDARLSFPTIFTVHGETLHNHFHGNVMRSGDIAINDSGAESPEHYAADITRTIPVDGRFTELQAEVYSIVLSAQERAIEAIRPGIEFRDVHLLACEVLSSGLKDLGLMKGDPAEAARAGAHTLFFQCGLGHLMGLDVHDMEGLGEDHVGYDETVQRDSRFGFSSLRLGRALQRGFVVTVEPGLYFIPELIDRWRAENQLADFIDYAAVERFRDFGGIRIEDDVLVTESGSRVLGRPIPKTIEELEAAAPQFEAPG